MSTENDFRLFFLVTHSSRAGSFRLVAHNSKPILNGNPSVEPDISTTPPNSARCDRLWQFHWEGVNGTIGVLTLYHSEKMRSAKTTCVWFLALTSKVALFD